MSRGILSMISRSLLCNPKYTPTSLHRGTAHLSRSRRFGRSLSPKRLPARGPDKEPTVCVLHAYSNMVSCLSACLSVLSTDYYQGRRQLPKSGGANSTIARCRRQCIEVRSADQSARSVENIFAFIFQLSGWALVAPSCFVLQVRDASPQETR